MKLWLLLFLLNGGGGLTPDVWQLANAVMIAACNQAGYCQLVQPAGQASVVRIRRYQRKAKANTSQAHPQRKPVNHSRHLRLFDPKRDWQLGGKAKPKAKPQQKAKHKTKQTKRKTVLACGHRNSRSNLILRSNDKPGGFQNQLNRFGRF